MRDAKRGKVYRQNPVNRCVSYGTAAFQPQLPCTVDRQPTIPLTVPARFAVKRQGMH